MAYLLPSKRPLPTLMLRHKRPREWHEYDRDLLRRILWETAHKARSRSGRRRQEHGITVDDVVDMFIAQEGRCALTGVEFALKIHKLRLRDPYRPSLDRISSDQGYILGNCRLVAHIANVARCDFGDGVFYEMCGAATRFRSGV